MLAKTLLLALTLALPAAAAAPPRGDDARGNDARGGSARASDARTADARGSETTDPWLDNCQVVSIEDQAVPGGDAGVLIKLHVKEGSAVKRGEEIALIDDREAAAQMVVKQLDYDVAQQEADSTIGVRYAEESANVAEAGYRKLQQANEKSLGSVSAIEVLRAKLEWKKAELQIEKAKEENLSAKLAARAKKAEVDAAKVPVERRVLLAPFDGVVMKIYRHEGEWISPGEPVVQMVRVDRLRVSGNLDAAIWSPGDVEGRKVTVEVMLPRGRTQTVEGQIVYASPVVALGHELPVWAEIESPIVDGRAVVRAGLKAKMTIHTTQPVAEAAPAAPPRRSASKN